jgi:hypothetical protein
LWDAHAYENNITRNDRFRGIGGKCQAAFSLAPDQDAIAVQCARTAHTKSIRTKGAGNIQVVFIPVPFFDRL